MFTRPTLDQQLERSKVKPPRHPFVTLGLFIMLLFSLGALLLTLGITTNSVPVSSQRATPATDATPTEQPLTRIAPPAAANLAPTVAAFARPERWSVRMVMQTMNGRPGQVGVVDDPRVPQMVWNDFVEAFRWLYTTGWHADYATAVFNYFSDGSDAMPDTVTMASGIRAFLSLARTKGEFVQIQVQNGSLKQSQPVFDFSPDGLQVHVRVTIEGASQRWTVSQPARLLSETAINPNTRSIYTLLYDTTDKRWKVANARLAP